MSLFAQNTYCAHNKGHRGAQQTTFMRGVKPGIKEILAKTGCQLRQMCMTMRHCLSLMRKYYEIELFLDLVDSVHLLLINLLFNVSLPHQ